jgi:hypothetical protein
MVQIHTHLTLGGWTSLTLEWFGFSSSRAWRECEYPETAVIRLNYGASQQGHLGKKFGGEISITVAAYKITRTGCGVRADDSISTPRWESGSAVPKTSGFPCTTPRLTLTDRLPLLLYDLRLSTPSPQVAHSGWIRIRIGDVVDDANRE